MKCYGCGKEIDMLNALHCERCGTSFCERCASAKHFCDCYSELKYYN